MSAPAHLAPTSRRHGRRGGCCGESLVSAPSFTTARLRLSYKALFDPRAMLSLVGSTVVAKFEDRLEESNAAIRTVTGGITRVFGKLKVMLEIDGMARSLPRKAVPNLDQDIILGMDFCHLFYVHAQLGRRRWRVEGANGGRS